VSRTCGGGTAAGFRDRVGAILRVLGCIVRLRRWAGVSTGTLMLALALPAAAEEGSSASECPSRDAVAAKVRGLLSQSHIEIGNIEADIELRDMGARYAVSVRGRNREYNDEPRDCVRRARVAAVFVALTIAPPDIGLPALVEEPPPPVEPTPTSPRQIPPSAPPPAQAATPASHASPKPPAKSDATWRLGAELGALFALAPRGDRSLTTLGAEGRVVAVRPGWGLTLGARWSTADQLELATSQIRQRRYPIDLGLRLQYESEWLKGSVDLGALVALLQLRQLNAAPSSTRTLVEAGARVGGTLWVSRSTIAPYIRGFAEIVPFPRRLVVEPRGDIGSTSPLWLGATIGLACFFD
jgi:hypothetical protein